MLNAHQARADACWIPALTAPVKPANTLTRCDAMHLTFLVRDTSSGEVLGSYRPAPSENVRAAFARACDGDLSARTLEIQYRKEATFGGCLS